MGNRQGSFSPGHTSQRGEQRRASEGPKHGGLGQPWTKLCSSCPQRVCLGESCHLAEPPFIHANGTWPASLEHPGYIMTESAVLQVGFQWMPSCWIVKIISEMLRKKNTANCPKCCFHSRFGGFPVSAKIPTGSFNIYLTAVGTVGDRILPS